VVSVGARCLSWEGSRSEEIIARLESPSRYAPMSPTVIVGSGRTTVLAEALYWGVRQTISSQARDARVEEGRVAA
jgi:hypothetical protein